MINPQPVYGSRSPYSHRKENQAAQPPSSPSPKKDTDAVKKVKPWKRFILLVFVGLLVGGTAFAYAAYLSLKKSVLVEAEGSKKAAILDYDPSNSKDTINADQFRSLGDGRFNMVLVGVDKAAGLTDSIQVLSFDTITKQASITSIPRDLFVAIPKHGRNKINAAYKLAEAEKAGNGAKVLKEVVGQVLGTTVTNFALIDFSGLKTLVDSIGGIEVLVPEAINDPSFPAETGVGFAPFSIQAGLQKMNGATALRYARSRKTTSDFDRSLRQQLVMDAIRKKTTSAGVVTNPVKLTGILKSIEKSFKTDLTESQIKVLFNLYNAIPDGKSTGYVLDTSSELKLLTSTTDPVSGYISYPIPGIEKYSEIHRWFRKNNPDPLLAREKPTVLVLGDGKATQKQLLDFTETLKDFGYQATLSPEQYKSSTKLTASKLFEAKQNAKPFARNYLSTQLGVSAEKGSASAGSQVDFQIVYIPSVTASSIPKTTPKPTVSPKQTPKSTPSPTISPSPSISAEP